MAHERRSHRLARQIRAELSGLITSEVDDPRVVGAAVTEVRLSRDLGHARVWVVALDETANRRELIRGLESAKGFLRRELSQRLTHLRRTPELSFSYDDRQASGLRVEQLLEGLRTSEASEETLPPES